MPSNWIPLTAPLWLPKISAASLKKCHILSQYTKSCIFSAGTLGLNNKCCKTTNTTCVPAVLSMHWGGFLPSDCQKQIHSDCGAYFILSASHELKIDEPSSSSSSVKRHPQDQRCTQVFNSLHFSHITLVAYGNEWSALSRLHASSEWKPLSHMRFWQHLRPRSQLW